MSASEKRESLSSAEGPPPVETVDRCAGCGWRRDDCNCVRRADSEPWFCPDCYSTHSLNETCREITL